MAAGNVVTVAATGNVVTVQMDVFVDDSVNPLVINGFTLVINGNSLVING